MPSRLLLFNLIGILFLMAVIMLQPYLPFNPQDQGAVSPDLAFNIAVSFVTNTNWQSYAGETTLSYFTQMVGLTVQNFLSAATGLAVLMALIRGIRQRKTKDLGNFWKDVTKATLILLPTLFHIGPGPGLPGNGPDVGRTDDRAVASTSDRFQWRHRH